jgi:hypothetical protein
MLIPDDRVCRRMAWIIFGIVAVLIVLTFRQYGVTWDEELQSQHGEAIVDYYLSGFKDQRYKEIFNLYLYGGMFDGLASLIARYVPFRIYDTRHFLNAFFGLLGLWGTWRLGKLMGGGLAGLAALILLVLTPMYYGHMFNNPKDIPFAAGIVWTVYFMGRCMADRSAYVVAQLRRTDTQTHRSPSEGGPRPKWGLILKLGVILGLTLGVRVGGVMVLAFWGVPVAWDALRILRVRLDGMHIREALVALIRDEARLVLPVTLIAYIVMLICWPWAQENPIMNPLRALSEFSNFPQDVDVLLDGTIYHSNELPWYYVPLYFGVQLPEALLALLAAFFAGLPWIWRRMDIPRRQTLTLILFMAFAPILYAVIRRPALYDAVRHFIFAVPLFCVLGGIAARHIYVGTIAVFCERPARNLAACALVAAFLIAALAQVIIMARLHPYEYIFANRFAGGVPGAFGRYEMDYWGSSFREAAEQLQNFVAEEGGVPPGKIYRIAICGPWDSAMIYLPPDYEPVVANEPADFFLSTTRWMCQNMRPGKDIIRIERMGVPLSVVKDLRGGFETVPSGK